MFPIEMVCPTELKLGAVINPASLIHIASVTTHLQSIEFTCKFPMSTSAIDTIVRENRGLEVVNIKEAYLNDGNNNYNMRNSTEVVLLVEDLVKSFSKCKGLRNIDVNSVIGLLPIEEKLRDTVTPFRFKAINFEFSFVVGARFFSTEIGRCQLAY